MKAVFFMALLSNSLMSLLLDCSAIPTWHFLYRPAIVLGEPSSFGSILFEARLHIIYLLCPRHPLLVF